MQGGERVRGARGGKLSVAMPMEVARGGTQGTNLGGLVVLEQGDAVPVEFKRVGQPQASSTLRQVASQGHEDGFGAPGRYANGHWSERLPLVWCGLCFELGEGERQFGIMAAGDVGHAAAEAQPTAESQSESRVVGQGPEI